MKRFTAPPSYTAQRKDAPLALTPIAPATFTWFY